MVSTRSSDPHRCPLDGPLGRGPNYRVVVDAKSSGPGSFGDLMGVVALGLLVGLLVLDRRVLHVGLGALATRGISSPQAPVPCS